MSYFCLLSAGFYSFFLYRRWYRCFTTLNAFSLDSGDLERKKDLTLDEFHFEYDGKKPVKLLPSSVFTFERLKIMSYTEHGLFLLMKLMFNVVL